MQPTPAGREVPLVSAALKRWLKDCPTGPVELGQGSGDPLWALLAGWSSTVVHAVAAGPRTAGEVQGEVGVLDAEAIDARIALLVEEGLLHALPGEGGDVEPLRGDRMAAPRRRPDRRRGAHGAAPPARGHRTDRRGRRRSGPAPDPAAAADEVAPPTGPARWRSSSTRASSAARSRMTARVEEGRVVACEPGADPTADAWAKGDTAEWLDAVIDKNTGCAPERRRLALYPRPARRPAQDAVRRAALAPASTCGLTGPK